MNDFGPFDTQNYRKLKKFYKLSYISKENQLAFSNKLKEDSSDFFNFKKRIENTICNIKQVVIYGSLRCGFIDSTTLFNSIDNEISIYLLEEDNCFVQSEKCLASHVLKQIVDNHGNVVSEEIKPFNYNGK
ncbi:MAG: hypothetical protein IJI42_09250 [Methanobrevibacter sp.]|nr:hypothetical protein [Methanobrevibacter sp.]